MEDFLSGQQERYELGPDVTAEVDEMYRLDVDAKPELDLFFDPQAFQQEHPQPLLKDWRWARLNWRRRRSRRPSSGPGSLRRPSYACMTTRSRCTIHYPNAVEKG